MEETFAIVRATEAEVTLQRARFLFLAVEPLAFERAAIARSVELICAAQQTAELTVAADILAEEYVLAVVARAPNALH